MSNARKNGLMPKKEALIEEFRGLDRKVVRTNESKTTPGYGTVPVL